MSKSPAEKRPKVYAYGAGRDWRIVTTNDLPVVYTIKEGVDVEALNAYVSCMGSKPLKESELHGETIGEYVRKYLRNINNSREVAVEYKHDPVGAMLVEEKVLMHSRAYPYGEGRTFPFAQCQLKKCI